MARTLSPTRRVWTVVYSDASDITGMGIAHFDDEAEAMRFAQTHQVALVNEEAVPIRIADRWTFTRGQSS
jgi:hypothetical protein